MALLQHTFGIMVHPTSEWMEVRKDRSSFKQVFLSHVPFLALIPVLSAYFGVTQIGWTVGDGDAIRLTQQSALTLCGLTYVALLVGVFVLGEFINWMAKSYGVTDSEEVRHHGGTALAVCIATPLLLAGVSTVYPNVWLNVVVLLLAGAYAVYLIYEGLPIVMNIGKERAFMYASSIVTVGLVLMVTAMITTVLIWGMGVGPQYMD